MTYIFFDFSFNPFVSLQEIVIAFAGINSNEITQIECEIEYDSFITNKLEDTFGKNYDELTISYKEEGRIKVQKLNNSLPRFRSFNLSLEFALPFISIIEEKFENSLVYSQMCDALDLRLQNTNGIDEWLFEKVALPDYAVIVPNPVYTSEKEIYVLDIESLPGHVHHIDYGDKLSFGSCWKMYFAPIYYKYIPKQLFDDFNDCFENVVFPDGLRRIILHENIVDFDLPENRARQWAFRRQLGIDSIAHELKKARGRIEPRNLPVLITKKDCKVGQTRVTRFLGGSGALVGRDLARKKEIKEYLDDGVTVVFEETVMLWK